MGRLQRFIACLLTVACLLPSLGRADDIDLYMINPTVSADRPNVLIFVDNTSNWSTYFANEVSALSSLLNGLSDQFNVGIMMFSKSNDPGEPGGVVRAAIRQMTSANRPLYASLVSSLDSNSDQSNSTTPYGRAMMEAWMYFNGMAAVDGQRGGARDYPSNTVRTTADAAVHALTLNAFASSTSSTYLNQFLVDPNCQKNFIIFISNGHPSTNEKNDSVPGAALTTAGGSASTTNPAISGSLSWNVMDNWAKFMSSHEVAGKARIYTYAVAVAPDSWPNGTRDDTVALLQSAGSLGKGGYYAVTGDASSILVALNDIFQKIIAVNSVFASVTLPVNVNVKGQYLNQIYMGVFRPDPGASPRWPGNLKEYRMEMQSDGTPKMIGRTSGQQIYNATSGFVDPTSISFWSTAATTNITTSAPTNLFGSYNFWDSTYYPDAQGAGVPPAGTRDGTADAPDGEMVEKGGVAQRLRGTYSYNATSSTARVPNRNVYTCTGTGCANNSATTLSSMPFTTGNTALTATVFGLGGNASISSLARGNSTCSISSCISVVTATTSTAHGLADQGSVTVSGASNSSFNGVFVATVTGSNSFTYQIVEYPAPVAVGTITMTPNGTVSIPISSVSAAAVSGGNRTVTLVATNHGLTGTVSVNITGITPSAYSGTQSVTEFDANTLQYTVAATTPETPTPGTTTFSIPYPTGDFYNSTDCSGSPLGQVNISSISRASGSTSLTVNLNSNTPKTTGPGAVPYNSVRLSSNPDSKYPGCYSCLSSDNANCKSNSNNPLKLTGASFTPATTLADPTYTSASLTASGSPRTVTALSRSGSNCTADPCVATVTATVSSTAGLSVGSLVTIAGAVPTDYNGTAIAVKSVGTGTFTYEINTTPARNATGGTASSATSGVSKDDLINWVRGQNVKGEDNPSKLAADVRGYLHGDVLHSQPAVINYNRSGITSDVVVYYGANDGMLHASRRSISPISSACLRIRRSGVKPRLEPISLTAR
jgi:type IV pilus assembly protein PilY1